VAVTYDGAVLHFYVNGRPTARRLRWYPGQVLATTLDGLTIPAGLSRDSPELRARLLAGAPLRVRAVAIPPVPGRAPLVVLHDAWRNEILLLAAHGEDLVFRLRTRAAAMHLQSPAIRAAGVLRGVSPGQPVDVVLGRASHGYCVEVNGRSTCGLGYTPGVGWALLAYAQIPYGWPHVALDLGSMATLLFPFGFWMRRRCESALGALLLIACLGAVGTIGNLSVSWTEITAAIGGLMMGRICALGIARAVREPGAPGTEPGSSDQSPFQAVRRICGGTQVD
jgi:hypothetical protein